MPSMMLNATGVSNIGLSTRLSALPDELKIAIIRCTVCRADKRLSLLIFPQYIETLALPLKHNELLHEIALEQAVRCNTFFWPRNAPSITPLAREIRHLEVDLAIIIDGGDVNRPYTMDLPGADVAKMVAIPYYFPKLATLKLNVDNTSQIAPGATFLNEYGVQVPAATFLGGIVMERCWKMAEVIERLRSLQFPRWRKSHRLDKRVKFVQSFGSQVEGVCGDPTLIQSQSAYAKAIYQILEMPVTKVVL